jgi:hypothetical protein
LEVTWEIHRLPGQQYEVRLMSPRTDLHPVEFVPLVTPELLLPSRADRFLTVGFAWNITVPPITITEGFATGSTSSTNGSTVLQITPGGFGVNGNISHSDGDSLTRSNSRSQQRSPTGGETIVRYYRFEAGHHRSMRERWIDRHAYGMQFDSFNQRCAVEYFLVQESLIPRVERHPPPRHRRRAQPQNCPCP